VQEKTKHEKNTTIFEVNNHSSLQRPVLNDLDLGVIYFQKRVGFL